MKKILAGLALAAIALTACGGAAETSVASSPPVVTAPTVTSRAAQVRAELDARGVSAGTGATDAETDAAGEATCQIWHTMGVQESTAQFLVGTLTDEGATYDDATAIVAVFTVVYCPDVVPLMQSAEATSY